jgi:hypothetical protein
MPRERVQHPKVYEYESADGTTGYVEHDPALDVTWQRDSETVQVSIEFPRAQWLTICADLKDDPEISHKAIFSGNLPRPEINHFIRTLKRARDAAYGADE